MLSASSNPKGQGPSFSNITKTALDRSELFSSVSTNGSFGNSADREGSNISPQNGRTHNSHGSPLANVLNTFLVSEGLMNEASFRLHAPPALSPQDFASKIQEKSLEQLQDLLSGLFNHIYKHAVTTAPPLRVESNRTPKDHSLMKGPSMTKMFGGFGALEDIRAESMLALSTASAMHRSVYQLSGIADCEDGVGTIAQFEVLAELGRGAFGVVTLAVDIDDQPYAIKTLNWGRKSEFNSSHASVSLNSNTQSKSMLNTSSVGSASLSVSNSSVGDGGREVTDALHPTYGSKVEATPSKSPAAMRAIQQEIALLKKIRHTNCVRLHAVIQDDANRQVHMVMQYVENGPLTSIREDHTCHTLPVAEALNYMTQVSTGLDYLHKHNIIHRDIKPENILIGKDKTAYVADFGVSGVVSEMKQMRRIGRAGTMPFQSPELIECQTAAADYGKESDVWAFGVTLYAVIVGKLPFQGWNYPSLVRNILSSEVEFPPEPEVDPGVQDLIRQLLLKDPLKRMTLTEFRHHPTVRELTGRMALVAVESVDSQPQGVHIPEGSKDSSATAPKKRFSDTVPFAESNAQKMRVPAALEGPPMTARDLWTEDAPFAKPATSKRTPTPSNDSVTPAQSGPQTSGTGKLSSSPTSCNLSAREKDISLLSSNDSLLHQNSETIRPSDAEANPPVFDGTSVMAHPPPPIPSARSSSDSTSTSTRHMPQPPKANRSPAKVTGSSFRANDMFDDLRSEDENRPHSSTPSIASASDDIFSMTDDDIRSATQRCSVLFTRRPQAQVGVATTQKVQGFVQRMRHFMRTGGDEGSSQTLTRRGSAGQGATEGASSYPSTSTGASTCSMLRTYQSTLSKPKPSRSPNF